MTIPTGILAITGLGIASLSLLISAAALWLNLFHRGNVKMTRPTLVALTSNTTDGPKIVVRCVLFCTGRQGRVVENLYVLLRSSGREDVFWFWGYGDGKSMNAAGLFVGPEGVEHFHHFIRPEKDRDISFNAGQVEVDVLGTIHGVRRPKRLAKIQLLVATDDALAIAEGSGILFAWRPDMNRYVSQRLTDDSGIRPSEILEALRRRHDR